MNIDVDQIQLWINQYRFYIIVILTFIVYQLGFARRLPILKSAVVYFLLIVGCVPLTILHILGLPIIAMLSISAVFLIVVQYRQKRYNPKSNEKGHETHEAP